MENFILVAFIDGIRQVPLSDKKTMETITNFFELKNGVFYFSPKKKKKFIKIMLRKK